MINNTPSHLALFLTILFSLVITACNNNDTSNKNGLTALQKTQKYNKETTLTGRVSTKKGNIKVGEITVTNSKNKEIAQTLVNKDSHFSVTIPAGTELPIILTFSSTANSADKDKLVSVAIFSALKKYDINDLTTLIAKKAKSLGGYTHSNMTIAADSTVGIIDANKTSTGFRGDPTSQYGGWH